MHYDSIREEEKEEREEEERGEAKIYTVYILVVQRFLGSEIKFWLDGNASL